MSKAEQILLKDGAVLSFNEANRLQVSLVEGDDQTVSPDPQILQDYPSFDAETQVAPGLDLTVPHEVRIQAAYPMLVEKELLNFSRMYYSHGSATGMLRIIASINGEALTTTEKAFRDLAGLHITTADFLDVLIAKNIIYSAQRKFFHHLHLRNEITQEAFQEYSATATEYQKLILKQAAENLASLNVRLFFGEDAKLQYAAMGADNV